jgi:H+/Cl- antiporter ClcA
MIFAALCGTLSSLLTVGYITIYQQGIMLFEQVSLMVLDINIWPLVLLTIAGVLIGLVIKFFGQNGGLGIAQVQYAQTGRINPRKVPSIILQGFLSLWSGAPVGPEGPLVFLTEVLERISQTGSSSRRMMFRYLFIVPLLVLLEDSLVHL